MRKCHLLTRRGPHAQLSAAGGCCSVLCAFAAAFARSPAGPKRPGLRRCMNTCCGNSRRTLSAEGGVRAAAVPLGWVVESHGPPLRNREEAMPSPEAPPSADGPGSRADLRDSHPCRQRQPSLHPLHDLLLPVHGRHGQAGPDPPGRRHHALRHGAVRRGKMKRPSACRTVFRDGACVGNRNEHV